MKRIAIGDKAPDFALFSQGREQVRLSDFLGRNNVVLYFYPKDFSAGCTAEAKAFRDSYQIFADSETELIGVSSDSVESHRRFSEHCGLPFNLLSDVGKAVRELYGVSGRWISGRVTFIIDKQGIVRNVFSSQLHPTQHVREALETLRVQASQPPSQPVPA
ncbi:MAG: peroxiredoxin [Thaumarchaeota archaeon]|nr:peroxiredoxin [Nitrososphaerota archaeon]